MCWKKKIGCKLFRIAKNLQAEDVDSVEIELFPYFSPPTR